MAIFLLVLGIVGLTFMFLNEFNIIKLPIVLGVIFSVFGIMGTACFILVLLIS